MSKKIDNFHIRFATEEDTEIILGFIKELAEYENLLDSVVATKEILHESLFKKKVAETIIGEYMGVPVGFALFFHSFSTFLGKPGIYLEDLYVKPSMRGIGIGSALLSFLAKLAIERDCARLDWSCLNWNEPSICFYKQMGARPIEDWTVYRVDSQALINLAQHD